MQSATKNEYVDRRLYPEKSGRWIYLILGLVLFSIFGLPYFFEGGTSNWSSIERVLAAPIAAFGVLCSILYTVQLLPGSWYLELTPQGFTFCSLYIRYSYDWKDVSRIRSHADHSEGCVVFDLVRKAPEGVVDRLARAYARYECAADDYVRGSFGLSSQSLADLMNELRNNRLAGEP